MKWKFVGSAVCAILMVISPCFLVRCNGDESQTTVTLTHAAPPVPALRYRFWPSAGESRSINAMPMFTRACFLMDQVDTAKSDTELNAVYTELVEGAWSDELSARAERVLDLHQTVQDELERCTNCMDVEFDLNLKEQDLVARISLLLPEVQKSRQLARLLVIRGHLQARDGQWAQFSRTVTSLFRVAEMTGHENAYLVGRLVRFAVISVTLDLVESASQLEGCPNFYWALSTVPKHLFDIQDVLELECQNPLLVFGVSSLPQTPIGERAAVAKLKKNIDVLGFAMTETGGGSVASNGLLIAAGLQIAGSAAACREILENDPQWSGRSGELSDAEVVLRANQMECRRLVDQFFSGALLPAPIREPYLNVGEAELTAPIGDSPVLPARLAVRMLLPALNAIFRAEHRIREQYIDAINLQAIRSGGDTDALPTDESTIPLPLWPSAGDRPQPAYKRTSATEATLERVNEMEPGQFKKVKVTLR